MVSLSRALAAAAALAAPVVGYQSVANCVPGGVVEGLSFTNGKIGAYAIALQAIMPGTYGDLSLLASTDAGNGACLAAANDINSNSIIVGQVLDKYHKLHNVGTLASMKNGSTESDYLYVFNNKNFIDRELAANCVPGSIVGADLLNKTQGKVGIYGILLKAFLTWYGDLKFLSKGTSQNCMESMNVINTGNMTFYEALKSGEGKEGHMMKEVGLLESLKTAEEDMSYLFVYTNKNWNLTYGVMDGFETETSSDDEGEGDGDEGESTTAAEAGTTVAEATGDSTTTAEATEATGRRLSEELLI